MRTCDKILHQECKCAQDSCCCFLPRCVFRRDGAAIKSGAPAPSISVRRLLSFRGVLTAFTLPGVSEVQNVRACSKPFCARHALGLVLGCQRSYFCCRSSQRLRCESAACTFPLIQSEFFGCVLRLLVSPDFHIALRHLCFTILTTARSIGFVLHRYLLLLANVSRLTHAKRIQVRFMHDLS
jgi:hypothetical protein